MNIPQGRVARRRAGLSLIILLAMAWVSGCVVYARRYETTGGTATEVGHWQVYLWAYADASWGIQVSAIPSRAAGVRPLFDELLLVDSLVVDAPDPVQHIVVRPDYATYRWSEPDTGPRRVSWEAAPVDPTRWRLLRWTREYRDRDRPPLNRTEAWSLVMDPPAPQAGTLAPPEEEGVPPLALLAPLTVDELAGMGAPDGFRFEAYFPLYDRRGGDGDRTVTLHLRVVDRRTAAVIERRALVFEQDWVGNWETWWGE